AGGTVNGASETGGPVAARGTGPSGPTPPARMDARLVDFGTATTANASDRNANGQQTAVSAGGDQNAQTATQGEPRPPRKPNPLGVPGHGTPAADDDEPPSPLAPPEQPGVARRRPIEPRPARLRGSRDWNIYIECRSDRVVLYPSRESFALAALPRGT